MKVNTKFLTKAVSKASRFWNKNGAKILAYGGTTMTLAGVVFTWRAALKVDKDLTVAKEEIVEAQNIENADIEIKKIKRTVAVKIVKDCSLAAGLVVGGTVCTLAGFNKVNKSAVKYAAAYTAVSTAFSNYRGEVIKRFGEEVDREIRLGKKETITETVTTTDKDGNPVTETRTVNVLHTDRTMDNLYTFRFDNSSTYWNKHSMDYNFMHIRSIESWAGEQLRLKGVNILSRDLEQLGIKQNSVSAVSGWVNDSSLGDFDKDRQISFGINWNDPWASVYRDNVTGEDYILLDMKVDGSVIEWLDVPQDCICFHRKTGRMSDWLAKSKIKAGIALGVEENIAFQKHMLEDEDLKVMEEDLKVKEEDSKKKEE